LGSGRIEPRYHFDDVVVCKEEFTSLNLDFELDRWTTIDDDRVVLFTHEP